MKLAILGGTGGTGIELIKRALADGHEVVAILRNPDKLDTSISSNLHFKAVKGDIFDASTMSGAFGGCDAVLSCLGVNGAAYRRISLYSESMRAVVAAMGVAEVRRLVAMTSWCTKAAPENPFWVEWLLKPLVIGRHCADMGRMEDFLAEQTAAVDFTTVRPGGLTDGPPTDKEIKAVPDVQFSSGDTQISRNDVARFMLSAIDKKEFYGHAVAIATV